MRRDIFSEQHDLFRSQFRRFVSAEVEPHVLAWNEAGITPRAIWKRMGEEGYLGANQPVEYGGAGGTSSTTPSSWRSWPITARTRSRPRCTPTSACRT